MTEPTNETVLLHEDFNGYHREQDGGTFKASQWDAMWNAAVTSKGDAGALKTETIDVTGQDSLNLSFDLKAWLSNSCADFEEQGQGGADSIAIYVVLDGNVTLLDNFTYVDGEFVGSETGQTFGVGAYSTIEYDGLDVNGATDAQFIFDSTVTWHDEFIKLDNVKVTGTETLAQDDDCFHGTQELLHEDFNGLHEPEQSDAVAGHTAWKVVNGTAFSTECKEGQLTFTEVDLDGHESGTLMFDIKVNCVHNFEDGGHYGDWIKVQVKVDGGHWVTIDKLERDGYSDQFIGDQSGQTFGDDGLTTLSYDTDGLGDASTLQYRIVSSVTASNEQIFVDNVKITADKPICDACGDDFTKVDFESSQFIGDTVEAGDIVFDQFEGVTITAKANGTNDNRAMIFDADNPTGGDVDLRNGNGNILIISEDLDSSDPDDNIGGQFFLDFDRPVNFTSFTAIDTEEGGLVELFDANGAKIGEVTIGSIPDAAVQTVDLSAFADEDVASAIITLNGSGAIDDLCFKEVVQAPDPAALGDFVWLDANADGIQDAGEVGIEGVTVTLTGGGADGVIGTGGDDTTQTTTTDATGFYEFIALNPGEEYQVTFDQPAGFEVSPSDQGSDDSVDSDGLVAPVVTLAPGEFNQTIDQGFFQLAGLGDFVWFDEDEDGVQDANELGVDGVTVELKDANGTVIDTTTTANGGAYSFTGLVPGTYSVAFTAPAGFAFTTANAGTDDTADSDADPISGMTQTVTLTSGEFNGTLDAGLIIPNSAPVAGDDMGMTCADEVLTIDLLDNDTDADNDTLSVISISDADETATVGQSITLADGAIVTLNSDGTVSIDGKDAYDTLSLGSQATDSFTYTVEDTDGATDTGSVTATFCGYANMTTVGELVDGSTVTFIPSQGTTLGDLVVGYSAEIISSSNGSIPLGTYDAAYCGDFFQPIDLNNNVLTTGTAYLATEANAALVSNGTSGYIAANVDSVNWVLNQDFTSMDNGDGNGLNFTEWEIQEAIWSLLNDGDTFDFTLNQFPFQELTDNNNGIRDGLEIATVENVEDIVQMALTLGDGFEAQDGDIFGIFIDPTAPSQQEQPFLIGVQFECLCDMM